MINKKVAKEVFRVGVENMPYGLLLGLLVMPLVDETWQRWTPLIGIGCMFLITCFIAWIIWRNY